MTGDVHADGLTLVFVRELRHSPERVWAALVRPELLARWAPHTADRDLGATGPATLTAVDDEESPPLTITVVTARPPSLLEHTWGENVLRWELEPTPDGGTRLTLRDTVTEPGQLPMNAAGWHLCLDAADKLLAGADPEPVAGAEALHHGWQELHDRYAEILGTAH